MSDSKKCRPGTEREIAVAEFVAEAVVLRLNGPEALVKHVEQRKIRKAELSAKKGGA